MERYKTTAWRRVVGYLNREVYPDILGTLTKRLSQINARGFDSGVFTTQRYKNMVTEIDAIVRTGISEARLLVIIKDLQPLAVQEAFLLVQGMEAAVPSGIGITFSAPSKQLLNSVVTARPFDGKILTEHFSKLDIDTRKLLRQQVKLGISTGETTEQIVRRFRGTQANLFKDGAFQTTRRNATTLVRTAVNHVSAHAREATYAANQDVVKGVLFVATLDNATTYACASLDGKVFPVNEGERPPIHMQCRSTTTPVLKSWRELGINLKEAPAGTRESMNGQVPAKTTYPEWFKNQPRADQLKVLGKGRLKLYDEGALTDFNQLLGPMGQPLTLPQLRNLSA